MSDEVAEWLRRWTANPICSARMASSPIFDVNFVVVVVVFIYLVLSNMAIKYTPKL